jgi:hypothetical protein
MALVLLGAALWSHVGVDAALLLTAAVAGVWVVASTVYAFAVGQLLYAALFASSIEGAFLSMAAFDGRFVVLNLVVGAVLFSVLFVTDAVIRWPLSTAVFALIAFLFAWGGLANAWLVDPLWQGAAAMLVAFALLAYGIHRYELVALGLVEGAES